MFASSNPTSDPTVPPGQRIYAIGDVHGETQLLSRLLRLIKADNDARDEAAVTLVFLGDLIDRGAGAADLLRTFARTNADNLVVLKGNHEGALVDAYRGNEDVLREWLPFGAAATLTGFGIGQAEIESPTSELAAAIRERIDPDLIDWLAALPTSWQCGDYLFVHAGIRPGVKLHKQVEHDLLWIRQPFLSSRRKHGKVIVHGHTVEPGLPRLGGNRIGIDTGGHEHGVLTALGLEGDRQWLLQANTESDARSASGLVSERIPMRRRRMKGDASVRDVARLTASIVGLEDPDLVMLSDALPTTWWDRARKMGTSGFVAAGFALAIAAVGGAIALRPASPVRPRSEVSIPIPDMPREPADQNGIAPPTGESVRTDDPPHRAARHARATAASDDPQRQRALEEDRVVTRKLNLDELSRQQPASVSRK